MVETLENLRGAKRGSNLGARDGREKPEGVGAEPRSILRGGEWWWGEGKREKGGGAKGKGGEGKLAWGIENKLKGQGG